MDEEAQEKLTEMAKVGDLLTEDEVKAIAYPLKPYVMKRPPSYVMAVVTQTALKLINRGYCKPKAMQNKLPKGKPPVSGGVTENCFIYHNDFKDATGSVWKSYIPQVILDHFGIKPEDNVDLIILKHPSQKGMKGK